MVYRHLVQKFNLSCRVSNHYFLKKRRDILFVHQCCHTSISLLRTFEEFVPREAQQDLRIDCVLAHERLVIDQSLRSLIVDADRGPVEDCVRARPSGRAGYVQKIRRRRTQSEEKGHRAEYAARGELLWLWFWLR